MTQMAGTGRARVSGATSKTSVSFMYLAPQWRRLEGWLSPGWWKARVQPSLHGSLGEVKLLTWWLTVPVDSGLS